MNKFGQVSILGFMLAATIIIVALGISYATWQGSNNAYTDMNCSTTTDDFVKAGCYTTDISPFFFIGGLVALAGMVALAKIIYG